MERKHVAKRIFDARLAARDAHAGNFLFLAIFLMQYIFIPLTRGALNLIDQAFIITIVGMLVAFNLLGMIYYRLQSANVGSSFILFGSTALLVYFAMYYFGPFNTLLFVILVFLITINIFGMCMNCRLYWNIPRRGEYFTQLDWTRQNGRKAIKIAVVTGVLLALAGCSYYSFWGTCTVRAADGAQTISSYWGSPTLTTGSWTSTITPASNTTLLVTNASLPLANHPPSFGNGSLAYMESVIVNGSSFNYCNYSKGARSYPNGTVFLSTPLPSSVIVNVTFVYVTNWIVLSYLEISQSTIISTYDLNSFFYTAHFFDAIQSTYVFQLFDYWHVKYYVNVDSGTTDAANAFNYLNTVPRCYRTLDWFLNMSGESQCKDFVGISLDLESGDDAIPVGNPGGSLLPPFQGILPNGTGFFPPGDSYVANWYRYNEENQSLYQQALSAYEGVYQYAGYHGKDAYLVFGEGEMHDTLDGDLDTTRVPVMPVGDKNVLFGIMSYEDGLVTGGRFQVYRDCTEQIHFFGAQGRSILLGWIGYPSSRWYSSDEVGFQHYINDCLIAQAAGITEIFSAPLNSIQAKWGDDAILRLHDALNVQPKQTFSFTAGPWRSDTAYIMDYVKNFDHPWIFATFVVLMVAWVAGFGMIGLIRRKLVKLDWNRE